ncbi:uncharacterized protein LOC124880547 [Girardinichthys multiradiatus]|uniref:uncharacterized protein LOC124880547 n=1 Tax=Girardinichthys multiradiatus TaxID=208333 RepID=UPI001FACAA65|nr:uncharacterized protein LOC124880547 [Girardinichthys multiradiatus]
MEREVEPPDLTRVPCEYHDLESVFSKSRALSLPACHPYDCAIDLLSGAPLPSSQLYKISGPERVVIENYITESLATGIIRLSSSLLGAGFFFVGKKDGSLGPCINYRGLNAITVKNKYALPLLSSAFEPVHGATIFTKLDLRNAYHLVRIRQGDEWKTPFKTPLGHKTWYYKKAREMSFCPGQQVLLLLPTCDNKLLVKWQGPYEVTRCVGKLNYELYMPERKKKYQTFHINLLKQYHRSPQQFTMSSGSQLSQQDPLQSEERAETVLSQLIVVDDEEEDELFFPGCGSVPLLISFSHLQPSQQQDIKLLLDPELFQEKPGFTSLIQHWVHLRDDAAPRRKFYRVPGGGDH